MSSPARVRFGIVSDAHLAPEDAEPYRWHNTVDLPHAAELLDAALAWLETRAIDALVLLGDLTEDADPDSFTQVQDRVLRLGLPVLAVPGNCDVDWSASSTGAFAAIACPGVTTAPACLPPRDGISIELIGITPAPASKQLRSVREPACIVGDSDRSLIFSHYPVLNLDANLAVAGYRSSGNLTDRAALEAELRAGGNPVLAVHGHLHVHDAQISGALLQLSCAALIEPPHSASVIEVCVQPDRITVERTAHSLRVDQVERLPVFAPMHGRWAWDGIRWSSAG